MANPLDFLRSAKEPGDKGRSRGGSERAGSAPASSDPSSSDPAAAAAWEQELAVDSMSAEEVYDRALRAVRKFFAGAARLTDESPAGSLPIGVVEEAASLIVDAMAEGGDTLVGLAVGVYHEVQRFVLPHSVNAAILSQRLARELKLSVEEQKVLCLAALVHDVGTVRIPREIFYKPDSLTGHEWEIMRKRPGHSRDILATLGQSYIAVAEISHQVHERLDGSGYPRGLRGESVALEASIVGAVDVFEAFIHPRPYKKTVPAAAMYGVDSLMRMSHQFGDGVLKALVRSIGLFPVGTFLKLNSGEIAKVSRGRQANPMRPTVEVVLDSHSQRVTRPKTIDLMTAPHLYVFRPLSPEDLREMDVS